MVKIIGKVWKVGNGFVVSVPKAYLDGGIVELGEMVELELVDKYSMKRTSGERIWFPDVMHDNQTNVTSY